MLTQKQYLESFLNFPTESGFELIRNKNQVIKEILLIKDNIAKSHFLYKAKRITVFDLLKQALIDNNLLFYSYIDSVKVYKSILIVLARVALQYSRMKEFHYICGMTDIYDRFAGEAARPYVLT